MENLAVFRLVVDLANRYTGIFLAGTGPVGPGLAGA